MIKHWNDWFMMKDEKNWICIAKGRHAECLWVSRGRKHQGREEVVAGAYEETWRKIWSKGYAGVCQEKFRRETLRQWPLGETAKPLLWCILGQQHSQRIFLTFNVDLFESLTKKALQLWRKEKENKVSSLWFKRNCKFVTVKKLYLKDATG